MKTNLITFITVFLIQTSLYGQTKIDSLKGEWKLEKYFSIVENREIDNWTENECREFLTIRINPFNKLDFVFTDQKDTIIFLGKIQFNKNGTIKINNKIHEIIYLGELEKCITASVRMDIRGILNSIFNYSIKDNKLSFLYNTPNDLNNVKKMVFVKQ